MLPDRTATTLIPDIGVALQLLASCKETVYEPAVNALKVTGTPEAPVVEPLIGPVKVYVNVPVPPVPVAVILPPQATADADKVNAGGEVKVC